MNLIENIELLLITNIEYERNPKNSILLEKRNKLKYYIILGIKGSPEKSLLLKNYLETKIFTKEKNNYLIEIYKEIEENYINSLKDLTLNQKRNFFEKSNRINKIKTISI